MNEEDWHSLKVSLLVMLLAKLLVLFIGYATTYLHEGPAAPLTIVMNEFNRWDVPHYLDIARNWYVSNPNVDAYNWIAFFPLYPILIRLTTFDFNYEALSALIVSNMCSVIAFIYLWKLTKLDFNNGIAQKAVLFLSIFPTAYFLSAPYTEGLFFMLVIASLYYGRRAKWPIAGILSLFAALTRMAGLVMLPTLLIEYLYQKGWRPRKINLNHIDPKILWTGLSTIGFLIYLSINVQVTGNAFTFMKVEANRWFNTLNPILGLKWAFVWTTTKPFADSMMIGFLPILFAAFGLVTLIIAYAYKLRPSYLAYMLITWMLAISTSWWISVPRYVMAMFPMFILFGLLANKNRSLTLAGSILSATLLCIFTVRFALYLWAF